MTACYNEAENVDKLIAAVEYEFSKLPQYEYEHVFIDNHSTDNTVELLKKHAATKKYIKIIVNVKNFGHIKSPYHGLMQCTGDASVALVADLQDPPHVLPEMFKKWEEGHKIVACVKTKSEENFLMYQLRGLFYKLLKKFSPKGSDIIQQFTGFGLYDKSFLDVVRKLDDPYPYFRGLVSDFGHNIYRLEYTQAARHGGKSNNNFFTLYDMAMLGFVNHSKIPLRMAAFIGFFTSVVSFLVALIYFAYKLIFWHEFQSGMAPLVIGVFFFSSVQLFFIGIIGEYIGAIYTQVKKRPLVVEKERINF